MKKFFSIKQTKIIARTKCSPLSVELWFAKGMARARGRKDRRSIKTGNIPRGKYSEKGLAAASLASSVLVRPTSVNTLHQNIYLYLYAQKFKTTRGSISRGRKDDCHWCNVVSSKLPKGWEMRRGRVNTQRGIFESARLCAPDTLAYQRTLLANVSSAPLPSDTRDTYSSKRNVPPDVYISALGVIVQFEVTSEMPSAQCLAN